MNDYPLLVQSIHPRPTTPSARELGNVFNGEREKELESVEVSSMVVNRRLASTPLPWVQWLSGKSNRKVLGSIPGLIPVDFSSLSSKLTSIQYYFL